MKTIFNTWLQNLPKPSCRIAAPLLTKYIHAETTLTSSERTRIDAHLAACESCRAEADAVRAVGTLLRKRGRAALPAVVPAADLWERIEGRIIAEDATRRRTAPLRPVLLFAPALAAVVVAVIFLPKGNAPVANSSAKSAPAYVAPVNVAAAPAPQEATFTEKGGASVANDMAKKETARVTMNAPQTVARQTDSVASVAAAPVRTRAKSVAKPTAPRYRTNDYVVVTVVPMPRETRPAVQLARVSAKKPVLVAANPKPAETLPTVALPAPVSASLTTSAPASLTSKTIIIVKSDTGTGVPETASPVTDTLIRQRQKRGLFGGYGATLATMPTGGDTAP